MHHCGGGLYATGQSVHTVIAETQHWQFPQKVRGRSHEDMQRKISITITTSASSMELLLSVTVVLEWGPLSFGLHTSSIYHTICQLVSIHIPWVDLSIFVCLYSTVDNILGNKSVSNEDINKWRLPSDWCFKMIVGRTNGYCHRGYATFYTVYRATFSSNIFFQTCVSEFKNLSLLFFSNYSCRIMVILYPVLPLIPSYTSCSLYLHILYVYESFVLVWYKLQLVSFTDEAVNSNWFMTI